MLAMSPRDANLECIADGHVHCALNLEHCIVAKTNLAITPQGVVGRAGREKDSARRRIATKQRALQTSKQLHPIHLVKPSVLALARPRHHSPKTTAALRTSGTE